MSEFNREESSNSGSRREQNDGSSPTPDGDQTVSRRTFLKASAAGLSTAVLPGVVSRPASAATSDQLTIGVLQPLSGDFRYYGQQSLWGFLCGLAYKAGTDPVDQSITGELSVPVGDVEYRLIIRDPAFSPDKAQTIATDLVQNENIDLLFGGTSSGAATRVIQTVVKPAQVPYIVGPAASASITADKNICDRLVFRANENTAMDARSGGTYVARETEVERVYLFGADYSFGRAVVNNYAQVLEQEGVEIVGRKLVPRGYSEWEGLLNNVQSAGAQGVVGGFTVATLPQFFTAILSGDYDFRVFGGYATEITTRIVGQTLEKVLGQPLTLEKIRSKKFGPFTTRYHWNQYDNEINRSFVDMYTRTYGKVPDLFTSGTFTAASALVQAVEAAQSTDPQDIVSRLRGMTVQDTPKGRGGYAFQTYNNQARSAMTVSEPILTRKEWSKHWNAAIMPGEPETRIDANTATIPPDAEEMTCSL